MALTPEDVVNKRFNPTKFREGYDQDEVDDFLDEVVVELRRLNQENEELRQRLVGADSRISELQRNGAQQAPQQQPQQPQQFPGQPQQQPQYAQPGMPAAAAAGGAFGADLNAMDPSNTNNLLQLARRLHEEHVREGMEKRDALIAEGHAAAARVVSDAEMAQRAHLGALEQERVALERRVEELRIFEREYRQKLRGYIEGQLRELESSNALTAGGQQQQPAAVTAAPQAAPVPQYQGAIPGPQSNEYAYPQPTEYPGFAGN
jgi:DivIVA domain-containing protein